MKTAQDVSTGLLRLSCEAIPTKPQLTNAGKAIATFLVSQ